MNEEEILNVGVLCGGRSSQKTYNNFVKMYSYAKENGFKGINITFIDTELDKLQQKVNQLEINWNELKKNLEKTKSVCCDIGGTRWNTYNKVLTYMEELENNVERLDKVGDK